MPSNCGFYNSFSMGGGVGNFFDSGSTTSGAFVQHGTLAGPLRDSSTLDVVLGAGYSIGPSAFFTNATNVGQLYGPFSTHIFTLGLIEIQYSSSTADGRTIGVFSVGAALGLGYAHLTTNTPCTTALGTCPALEGGGQ